MCTDVCLQQPVYVLPQSCPSSQYRYEGQESSDRSDDVGQCRRSPLRRQSQHGGTAAVPSSVQVHRLHVSKWRDQLFYALPLRPMDQPADRNDVQLLQPI